MVQLHVQCLFFGIGDICLVCLFCFRQEFVALVISSEFSTFLLVMHVNTSIARHWIKLAARINYKCLFSRDFAQNV